MGSTIGIDHVFKDANQCNHLCQKCLCFSCMKLRFKKSSHCLCHLDLKNCQGLNMAMQKKWMSCRCWHTYRYVLSKESHCVAKKPNKTMPCAYMVMHHICLLFVIILTNICIMVFFSQNYVSTMLSMFWINQFQFYNVILRSTFLSLHTLSRLI